jgi:RND family efflux transporter MFP subunit
MNSSHFNPLTLLPNLRRHPILLATGILALSATLFFAATASPTLAAEPAKPATSPAPKVTVAPVEQRLVTEFEELTGHVDAVETVELRARVSGHLEAVNFSAGQIVNKGDVLFTIDSRWYKAQLDLAVAHADVAAREAKRADDLSAAAVISNEEAESRRARAAEAAALLDTARLDFEHTQVRAPIAGRIGRAYVTPGNLISGNPGSATLLTTIVATGDAYVYADVDESTLLKFNRLSR